MSKYLGGFQCSKITLIGLNIFYVIVGIILISLSSKWQSQNEVTSLPTIDGIIACGIFLIVISILGIYGAMKHHQVLLFFYMVILFIVFVIQFSVACACLSVSTDSQMGLARSGWSHLSTKNQIGIEKGLRCCGFDETVYPSNCTEIETCQEPICKAETLPHILCPDCPNCKARVLPSINQAFQIVGGVSLFFSFTEFVGVWLTYRYRNMGPNYQNRSAALL